ncbi:uncharacterized protein [Cicer arietinum]|uniref:WD repeat-containing protein 87-like n=1 Tax=Cicer arietinum TaxID=3827 RepID=A0A1S2Z280_CICAR|nr:WD repeat-containing protein 87-like [Cicer arietinum]
MKTISGTCDSSKEISLSKATKILSKFVSADNGASNVINAYLRRASEAFTELNHFHKDLKPLRSHRKSRKSHTTDDTGRVVGNSVTSVDLKSENEFGKIPKKEQNEIESGHGFHEGEMKQRKQKKEKKKDKNVEGENAKEQKQCEEIEKKISNGVKDENLGIGNPQEIEIRSKKKHEAASENVKGQEQVKEIEKKISNGVVEDENGGLVGSRDIEIRSKKRYELGSENKLNPEEVKMEQKKKKKKKKNEGVEERSEDRSGEHSKKRMKMKHESYA